MTPPEETARDLLGQGEPAGRREHPSPGPGADVTIAGVVYDEDLAERIRELLDDQRDITEKKMFGGLAFLLRGHMAIAASGQGGVLVRVDPAESEELIASTNASRMEMQGREMSGWLRVDADDLRTKRQLEKWVKLGTSFVHSLPPKN